MKIIQSASKIKNMCGYSELTGKIYPLNFQCVRKPCICDKKCFVFLSHPKLLHYKWIHRYRSKTWFHCLRRPKLLKSTQFLLPESDFVDEMFYPHSKTKIKYDYFYFTVEKDSSILVSAKGVDVFLNQVQPVLNSMGLKGIIVVYFSSSNDKLFISDSNVKVVRGWQPRSDVCKLIASCKFGIFPNIIDCSPRMIPECFIQNRPVLLNKNILGGWHYLERHPNLGRFFDPTDPQSIEKSVNQVVDLPRNQREIWSNNFGFKVSSKKLANFLRPTFQIPKKISHIYFSEYQNAFESFNNPI